MSENVLKIQQPSISVNEQIENLLSLGLIINDKDYAHSILSDISYFRLIKAYSMGLKTKNGNYHENVRFEDIVELYLFNSNFRQALFPFIEKLEINLRCKLAGYLCNKYGVLCYEDKNNFSFSIERFQTFCDDIQKEINRNARAPFIKNFRSNYADGKIPLYALVEILSFGTLSKLYKAMKKEDKKAIASQYGTSYTYLESWIESLSHVRNICAHYGRLYNAKLTKTPRLYKKYIKENIRNYRIFAPLLSLKYLLPNDRHWHDFVQTVEILIDKYPSVKLHRMGFPQNWVKLLTGSIQST